MIGTFFLSVLVGLAFLAALAVASVWLAIAIDKAMPKSWRAVLEVGVSGLALVCVAIVALWIAAVVGEGLLYDFGVVDVCYLGAECMTR